MKKRNKKTTLAKELRALMKEQQVLRRAKFNLGYVQLEKPIHDGWYKHLRLREDVARRIDAAVFEEILKMTGLKIRARTKVHADKSWNECLRKSRSFAYPGLRRLKQGDFNRLSHKAQKWFVSHGWYWTPGKGFQRRYYCTVPRYFFQLSYSKAYITERKIIDPQLESRIRYIENRLESPKYYNLNHSGYGHLYYGLTPTKRQRKRGRALLRQYDEEEYFKRIYHP